MKGKQHMLSTMKHRLNEKRRSGENEVIWQLSHVQKEYLENLGYKIIPWLYRINTRQFANISLIRNKLIRDVHYARKRGCFEIYKNLSEQDRETLREINVKYTIQKYKIIL